MPDNLTSNQNVGHGHVFPRPDGVRARCGGPSMCSACAKDLARKNPVLSWLLERAKWLDGEMRNGGNLEHLRTRYEECMYIHNRIGGLLPDEPAAGPVACEYDHEAMAAARRNYCHECGEALTSDRPAPPPSVARMREGLEIIAGFRQCADNTMSDKLVAIEALRPPCKDGGAHVWRWAEGDGPDPESSNPCLKCGVEKWRPAETKGAGR